MRRLSPFTWSLGAIAGVALAIRVVYDIINRTYIVLGDAMTFHQVAQKLADGHGFIQPFGPPLPTAEHPPAYEVFLAGLDLMGANGYLAHRLAGGVIGTAVVVLVGLLGRRVGGDRVGVLAAAIAAVYPIMWTADGSLMSETLYGLFVVCALLTAFALRDRPGNARAALLGALLGLAALTRGEGLVLLVLLVIPIAWRSVAATRDRVRLIVVAWVAFALVLAPWTIRNLVTFPDTPTLISTNANGLFAGANCRPTYYGDLIGSWRFQCNTHRDLHEDEARYFAGQRTIGLRYAREHAGRLPIVLVARMGRLFDVFRRGQAIYLNSAEGRPAGPMRWALRASVVLLVLAVAGALLLRRRRDELIVLLSPVLMVILVGLLTYGTTRFRHAAEPSTCVLAAFALVAAFERLRRRASTPTAASTTTATSAG